LGFGKDAKRPFRDQFGVVGDCVFVIKFSGKKFWCTGAVHSKESADGQPPSVSLDTVWLRSVILIWSKDRPAGDCVGVEAFDDVNNGIASHKARERGCQVAGTDSERILHLMRRSNAIGGSKKPCRQDEEIL